MSQCEIARDNQTAHLLQREREDDDARERHVNVTPSSKALVSHRERVAIAVDRSLQSACLMRDRPALVAVQCHINKRRSGCCSGSADMLDKPTGAAEANVDAVAGNATDAVLVTRSKLAEDKTAVSADAAAEQRELLELEAALREAVAAIQRQEKEMKRMLGRLHDLAAHRRACSQPRHHLNLW